MTASDKKNVFSPVAIIGMGCIFPESQTLKEFWHLLFNGVDAIGPVPEGSHWKKEDYYDPDPSCPDHTYCSRGGFLPDIAFDPLSYGIPPNNLKATDTSQLLGLEVARMALTDAGYPPGHKSLTDHKVNVILGVTGTQELVISLGARLGHPHWKKALEDSGVDEATRKEVMNRIGASYLGWQENSFPGLLGNVVAGRIANRLNLNGTNAVSDAACASSLSAVHTAVMELQTGRCDISITGGVDTLNDIFMHMCFAKTGVLSHGGDARPFSKDADGTVLGEGVGMMVLKRLEDAERDKDRIYAVIRGMGTSSDGKTSAIYAPESKGQLRALNEAYAQAGFDPATVGLIEAHGTGTRVGDKVEFTALGQCFPETAPRQSTAVGTVKSMIGHAKAAAGAAGMIKAALALYNKVLPPTLKAGEPDPALDICNSPFYLNDRSKPWIRDPEIPRRSGISAFGFGGSNFHVVLEEYSPAKSHVAWDGSIQIFAFCADDDQALKTQINRTRQAINTFYGQDQKALGQAVAWQAAKTRQAFSPDAEWRLLAVFSKGEDIDALFDSALSAVSGDRDVKAPLFLGRGPAIGKLGFVFPGQGSQYPSMACDLMSIFPEGEEALALADRMTCRIPDGDFTETRLSRTIFPLPAYAVDGKAAAADLRRTQAAQPAIGAVSLAMNDILNRFGIRPQATCGHSFGELSALYSAGWMDRETFLNLSAARGHFMARAGQGEGDPGSMLAVLSPIDKIQELIREENLSLVLANLNSPTQGVLSGTTAEIDRALSCCKTRKLRASKLPVAAAFHSELVESAAVPFSALVAGKKFTPSDVPVLSNTTGKAYPKAKKQIQALLGNQLMHPVSFIDDIRAMHDKGISTFIEVGPKSVLTGLVKSILKDEAITVQAVDASAGKKQGLFDLAQTLCTVASLGHAIDLSQWEDKAPEPEKHKMTVMLNGANLKPAPVQPKTKQPAAAPVKVTAPETPKRDKIDFQGPAMTPNPNLSTPEPSGNIHQARPAGTGTGDLSLIQQGLTAMQQLQEQTARAHEKFLETQAQASRTLAEIMAQTRGDLTVPIQERMIPVPPPAPVTYQTVQPVAPVAPVLPEPVPVAPSAAPAPQVPPVIPAAPETTAASVNTGIKPVLFSIVSRLTGFPEEMLESQMDIESDLGIDSIKKVEIISELEKELPQGGGISSEHLTTVRTLQDICNAVDGPKTTSGATEHLPRTAPAVGKAPEPAVQGDKGKILSVLVKIINDLTGFPEEMLEPQMSLESDLGIDSIKRVEILSHLEHELPDLSALSPDEMARLSTIEDIVSYLVPDDGGVKKKLRPQLKALS